MDTMLAPGGISIVDPAFADHGKRYSGLSEEYARAMEGLCRRADIILPNVTEAAMFTGIPYREKLDEGYVTDLLDALNHPCVILTGTGYEPEFTGVTLREGKRQWIQPDPIREQHVPHRLTMRRAGTPEYPRG